MTDGLKDRYRQAIVEIISRHPRVERAVLFGSRAIGGYKTESDIDLALFGDGLTLTDLAQLLDAFDHTSIPQRVDAVLFSPIRNETLIDHIRSKGVVWYDAREPKPPTQTVSNLSKGDQS